MNKLVTQEAEELIYGDRAASYGSPIDNFNNIAYLWKPIIGTFLTPEQVALCMVQVKIARQTHLAKRDNIVDAIGYLALIEKIENEKEERVSKS